jgi:hypothetical protein
MIGKIRLAIIAAIAALSVTLPAFADSYHGTPYEPGLSGGGSGGYNEQCTDVTRLPS